MAVYSCVRGHFLHQNPSCLNIDKHAPEKQYLDKRDMWEKKIMRVLAKVSTIVAVSALL
jgi:hypothetical protein